MPWSVEKSGNGFNVVKKGSGKVVGHHPSRERALAQMRALYANVPEPGNEKPKKDRSHKQNQLRSAAARRAGKSKKPSFGDPDKDKDSMKHDTDKDKEKMKY